MSWVFAALLAAAVGIFVVAEWPRLARRLGMDERTRKERRRQASHLQLVRSDRDDFAESVRRDLDSLPTIEEHESRPK